MLAKWSPKRTHIFQHMHSRSVLLFILFFIALLVRLMGSNTTLVGDQLSSLREAQSLGTNFQGLPYFLILKIFMGFSMNVVWMRIPSILLGSLAVPMCWVWLRPWRGVKVATITSLLFALSPLAIEYSQEIRFYGLYLFAIVLFFWMYTRILLRPTPTRNDFIYLILATLLLVFSHLLGIVIVFLTSAHWAICNARRVPRWLWAVIILGAISSLIVVLTAILVPALFESAYQAFMRAIASSMRDYTAPRGWSWVIAAKGAWIGFNLLYGQYVYPLNLVAVLPGTFAALLLVLLGLTKVFREKPRKAFYFLFVIGFLGICGILMIFEPLVPSSFIATASARHLIWTLPLFLWLLAEGLSTIRNSYLQQGILLVLILIQGFGAFSFYNSNTNTDEAVEKFSELNSSGQDVMFFVDGRAGDIIHFYLNNSPNLYDLWNYRNTSKDLTFRPQNPSRVAVMTLDEKDNQRCENSQFLAQMARYPVVFSDVKYPLFAYVFDTTSPLPAGIPALPQTVFHPRFQDLVLPQAIDWHGYPSQIVGVYTLPDCIGSTQWAYTFDKVTQGKSLLLLSNLVIDKDVPDGDIVAQIEITTEQGDIHTLPIRKGYETQTWNGKCLSGCDSVLTWSKHLQIVGFSAYPGAYDRFEAHIWGVDLPLNNTNIQSLRINMIASNVELNVWGLAIVD